MSRTPYLWVPEELRRFMNEHRLTPAEFGQLVGKEARTVQYVLEGKTLATFMNTVKVAEVRFPKAGYSLEDVHSIFRRRT